jgi:diaminopimelate dehydrogenase
MMIRAAIVGYGNLGKGVEEILKLNSDFELKAIFSRRDISRVKINKGVNFLPLSQAEKFSQEIDIMFLCGGSATDLPVQGPELARLFNTVDSFDNHNNIPKYFEKINEVSIKSKTTALISTGWDPGLFSLARVLFESVLPQGISNTFWGNGVSQGHSDALRRIPGVVDARQYTIPEADALKVAREGGGDKLTIRQKHKRVCYVVPEFGADQQAITKAIVTMPDYFEPYDTTVNFISAEDLKENHSALPHGGFVIHSLKLENGSRQTAEFSLKLDSNPLFTAGVMVACGRAVNRMAKKGVFGALTIFDLTVGDLANFDAGSLRKNYL